MAKNSVEIDGTKLRRLTRRLRMTVQELAAAMGRDPQTIYRMQQGRGDATFQFLDELSEVAGREAVAEIIASADDREDFLNVIRPK